MPAVLTRMGKPHTTIGATASPLSSGMGQGGDHRATAAVQRLSTQPCRIKRRCLRFKTQSHTSVCSFLSFACRPLLLRKLLRTQPEPAALKSSSSAKTSFGVVLLLPHGSLVPVSFNASLRFLHTRPIISVVVFNVPSGRLKFQGTHLRGASFVLRCFQHLSLPRICFTGRCHWHDNPNTSDASTRSSLVLGAAPQFSAAPTANRDRTVSRRLF